ncbi:MAG TPA: GNAT family N-acetyltransferase [Armatimonadota bacterium]|nr:GNAT family N-acetyltransferase [Armatimonadota bacterium]
MSEAEATNWDGVDRAALLDRLHHYHHLARTRLGCAASPVGSNLVDSYRVDAIHHPEVAVDEEFPNAPIVVYTHRDLPWRYFNHAAIYRRDSKPDLALIEEAADRMQRAGRVPCFDLPMDGAGMAAPTDVGADRLWEESALRWTAELQRSSFVICDRLLAMGRPIVPLPGVLTSTPAAEIPSPPHKSRYSVILMPRDAIGRQVKLHRSGFETSRGRARGFDRLVMETNLAAGVEYLWAMDHVWRQPVGSAALLTAAGVTEMFALSVVPRRRSCGIGGQLTQESIRRAALHGSDLIYLETEPGSRASSLYGRHGFVPIWSRFTFARER